MADNTLFQASTDPTMPRIADREVLHSGELAKLQLIALTEVVGSEGDPATVREYEPLDSLLQLIEDDTDALITLETAGNAVLQEIENDTDSLITLSGALTETAPASDTASSGLNGRLQRIAQRLTSLIALLPTALTSNGGALKAGAAEVVLTASVASGQTLQGTGSDLAGLRNLGIIIPSTFDGTQIQFQMSDTLAGTYVPVYDILNTRVLMTVAASRYYPIPGELWGVRFLKIECLTSQTTSATDFLIIGKT